MWAGASGPAGCPASPPVHASRALPVARSIALSSRSRPQILENTIKYRWKTLPAEQCSGVKAFVVNLVIARSSAEDSYRSQKLFMNKLNVILVQVAHACGGTQTFTAMVTKKLHCRG